MENRDEPNLQELIDFTNALKNLREAILKATEFLKTVAKSLEESPQLTREKRNERQVEAFKEFKRRVSQPLNLN